MRLVYFSPVPADSYAQRPHFMVRAWLQWGVESVLWVNPYPCRLPRWQDLRRTSRPCDQGELLDQRVHILNVPALPIEPLPWGAWLNRRLLWRDAWREIEHFAAAGSPVIGVGRPCALALETIRRLHPAASFFDAMDCFPEFHSGLSRRAMRRHEDAIAAEVDLVVASSTFLANRFARRGLRVEKVLNACDSESRGGEKERGRGGDDPNESFRSVSPSPPFPLSPSGPVLGYLGCIGRWFDWPLVLRLAGMMPHVRIELVGPCVVPPPGGQRLPDNLRLAPACRRSEAGGHLARFAAGLIPFKINALTSGVDPIKYYDYRAAGLPVLSARFGEMALRSRCDSVYFLDPLCDWRPVVSAALGHRCNNAETNRFRQENNWTDRFRQSDGLRALLPASRMRRAA
jgi:hypothetical protein